MDLRLHDLNKKFNKALFKGSQKQNKVYNNEFTKRLKVKNEKLIPGSQINVSCNVVLSD
jgi:hypothetical protein